MYVGSMLEIRAAHSERQSHSERKEYLIGASKICFSLFCSVMVKSWNDWVDSLKYEHPEVTYKTASHLKDLTSRRK